MKPRSKEYNGQPVMLNPDWTYVRSSHQTVEHLKGVFDRERERIAAEKSERKVVVIGRKV